jgi:tRNA dimethylallyltransferase
MIEPLVVIVGPTASGKSAFAMQIAKKFNGEIICADSRTIYKGMDIGTAKPNKQDQAEARHHLLDVVNPDQSFTAADFKGAALAAIKDIWGRGKLPIMVGGSGLYVDSVIFDYELGGPANAALRHELSNKTVYELQAICRQKSIELPENHLNKRYLIRAIELGGLIQQSRELRANTVVVGITTKKDTLQKRIEQRAEQMVKDGIIREVRNMANKYGWEGEAMKGNIYRVFRSVVEGDTSLEQGILNFVASDKKLVKKQLTWFKRNPDIVWGEASGLTKVIEQFIKSISP